MKLLLDTSYLIWLTDSPNVITPTERALVFADENAVSVSAISLWEIRHKWKARHKSGERKLETTPKAALRLADFLGFQLLAISPETAGAVLQHPTTHKDPFDEMLILQAQEAGLLLLTRDRLLADHPLALCV